VAENVWGVIWNTAAIIGGSVSTLLGVVVGIFLDRWVRHRGVVHCQIARLEQNHSSSEARKAFKVSRSVQLHFFNDKEVDTGLYEITAIFAFESGEKVALEPYTRGYETSTSPPGTINLPSKTWVSVHIKGDFYGPRPMPLSNKLKAVEIQAKFPDGTLYRYKDLYIHAGDDVSAELEQFAGRPWWRRLFS
jgi:hypothetical protein